MTSLIRSSTSVNRFAAIVALGVEELRGFHLQHSGGTFKKVSYEDFMDVFIRPHVSDEYRGPAPKYGIAFQNKPQREHKETDLYESFVSDVEDAELCYGYQIALSPNKADEKDDTGEKVDGGLYIEGDVPTDGRPHWDRQKLWIEWKKNTMQDAFDDVGPIFESLSKLRTRTRGQLLSYAAKVFGYQHRKFLFSVMITSDYARLICWDRSSAVVTERFDYRNHPKMLGEFLHMFCRLPSEHQGYDLTATPIKEGSDDHDVMLRVAEDPHMSPGSPNYAREVFKDSLDISWPWFKLFVVDEGPEYSGTAKNQMRSLRPRTIAQRHHTRPSRNFLVGKPLSQAFGVTGYGTREYVAFDVQNNTFVFLKDEWRPDNRHTRKEGDVLCALRTEHVRHTPTLICHGDVRDPDGSVQGTRNRDFWTSNDTSNQKHVPTKFIHYRLVQKEVGRPLSQIPDSYSLVNVISQCMKSHKEAIQKTNTLHGNISADNVLFMEIKSVDEHGNTHTTLEGLLCGWDFSQSLLAADDGDEQHHYLRIWQFVSARLLTYHDEAVVLQDDLESFFHVLLYYSTRYFRHNCRVVGAFLHEFFDGASIAEGQYCCGAKKTSDIQSGAIRVGNGEPLEFLHDNNRLLHPLNRIIRYLVKQFGYFNRMVLGDDHSSIFSFGELDWVRKSSKQIKTTNVAALEIESFVSGTPLENHDAILDFFARFLAHPEIWPENDHVGDQVSPKYRHHANENNPKRHRPSSSLEETQKPPRKRRKK